MRILFLDLDTLRADHLGCYGYHRATSPNLDRIAAGGVRFDGYYCSDAPCLPSRAALFTGRFGIHTGVVNHGGVCADLRLQGAERGFADRCQQDNLPAFLRAAGLRTATISPFAERHGAWWFYAGFDEIYNTGRRGQESAEHVTPTALRWIDQHAREDDWFLHVNYWDPHTPYRAPAEFGNPFADAPLPPWPDEAAIAAHQQAIGPHTAREIGMYDDTVQPQYPRYVGAVRNLHDWRRHIDGYDCGIAYMDSHIGRVLNALADQGVLDDLAVIVTSDHAENQGELGIYAEHATADHATCRIPMILRWPGGASGVAEAGLHYNLDLLPTLAALLEREPRATWAGESYAPALLRGDPCGRDALVISQCAHVCQRSARFGDWLYTRTYHDGYHLFPDEMLYNIANDPYEQRDLASTSPEVAAQGARVLAQWHDAMMASQLDGYDTDPLQIVLGEGGPYHARGHLGHYCERLEATGRGWAVPELRRRHPGEA